MKTDIHSLLPKLAIAASPVLLAAIGYLGYRRLASTYDVPDTTDVFQTVQGRWTWNPTAVNCSTNFFTVRFTPDHSDMLLIGHRHERGVKSEDDSVTRYAILGHTRHSIEVVRPGERDLTANGTPVVWDAVLRSPNAFAWQRGDWPAFEFSAPLHRCRSP